jgi:hypothetical protein
LIRDDLLTVVGAPHNWQQAVSLLHWLANVVDYEVNSFGKNDSGLPSLLQDSFDDSKKTREDIFEVIKEGIERKIPSHALATDYVDKHE